MAHLRPHHQSVPEPVQELRLAPSTAGTGQSAIGLQGTTHTQWVRFSSLCEGARAPEQQAFWHKHQHVLGKESGTARVVDRHFWNRLRKFTTTWKHHLTTDRVTKIVTLRNGKAFRRQKHVNLFHCLLVQKPSAFYLYWNGFWLLALKIHLFEMHTMTYRNQAQPQILRKLISRAST